LCANNMVVDGGDLGNCWRTVQSLTEIKDAPDTF